MAEEKIRHRSYGSPHVDGFRDDEEESVAYCPREKKKKTGKEHRRCDYHAGEEKVKGKGAEAVRCRYGPRRPRRLPRRPRVTPQHRRERPCAPSGSARSSPKLGRRSGGTRPRSP
jgi:hypothetical protein